MAGLQNISFVDQFTLVISDINFLTLTTSLKNFNVNIVGISYQYINPNYSFLKLVTSDAQLTLQIICNLRLEYSRQIVLSVPIQDVSGSLNNLLLRLIPNVKVIAVYAAENSRDIIEVDNPSFGKQLLENPTPLL